MRLLIIIVISLFFGGCANDNTAASKGIQAFEAEDYATAVDELTPLAIRGNPEAQFYVAKMHYFGFGVAKDLDIAFVRYTDSAQQGYIKAQHNLGLMYINGLSINADPVLGYEWISKAAAQGFALSQFMMGVALTMEGSPLQQDITKGLEYFEAAALQNQPEAYTQLGQHYAFREIDTDKALEYFDKAAELGDPQAQHRLSYIYMDGTLRSEDKEKAHNLLRAAASKSYLPSYYDLAMSYIWSKGVTQNFEEGFKWMKKSATDANDPRAMESLAQMLIEHRSGYLIRVEDLDSIESGIKWRKKAAALNDASAQLNLFVQYYNGDHVSANRTEAIKWLKASAKNGSSDAQYELAKQYINGWDVPKDENKGFSLYETAAKKGHIKASRAVGGAYFLGLGVDKNAALALKWLKKYPDKDTAVLIGAIYMDGGVDVKKDLALAEKWFRESGSPESMMLVTFLYIHEKYGLENIEEGIRLALEIQPLLDEEQLSDVQMLLVYAYNKTNNVKEKFYWLNKLSLMGNNYAQTALGLYRMTGDGIEKDADKGIQLLTEAAQNGGVDAQYFLGLMYSVGSEELDFGRDVAVDEREAQFWLSRAVAQGDKRADEVLAVLSSELRAREKEIARKQEIERLERRAKLERVEREKRALEKQLAEYRRQQEVVGRQSRSPSLGEILVGGFFEALGQGVGLAVTAKINKELGIKSSHEQQLDDFRNVVQDENDKMRRKIKKDMRMQQIMKNLRTTPKIGCESYGC